MRLGYDGPEGTPFDVPEGRLAAVLTPQEGEPLDEDALYAAALRDPLEAPRLRDLASGAGRVLLIVDDATRSTPVAAILPHVAAELEEAGVEDARVTVLTAQGTHRRMTRGELERKIGRPFLDRWRVAQHDYLDDSQLEDLGTTPTTGMPVVVNRLLVEADVAVGIGHVGVHGIMGFSGGAKIVIPGVAGAESETSTHWRASQQPEEALMGVLETRFRLDIEEAARMAGLDAVFNVAMDARGRVQRAAFGDVVAAQRACAHAARGLWAARLDAPADVVVVEARPADQDYWQSIKGLYCGALCVREGGVIVLVAPNPEGVAGNHPNVVGLAGLPEDEIRRRVAEGEVEDVIGAAIAAFTARFRARSDLFLVSSGMREEDATRMGFAKYATPQAALDEALRRVGPRGRVAVVRQGGGLLPVVRGVNDSVLESSREPRLAG